MLDRNDKQWITEVLDEKLSNTKTELRGEMQEMKTELRGEMQEMKTELSERRTWKRPEAISPVWRWN